jgi:uncharacterized membrane protein YoaK (UPF0700 family)
MFPAHSMLVAQAHTFTQKARLAVTLAWVAGYVNLVCIVVCGKGVSHVTGTLTAFGKDISDSDWEPLIVSGWLLWWFFAGAFASGVATAVARAREWKSAYALPIAAEAGALLGFAITIWVAGASQQEGGVHLEGTELLVSTAFACFAMGLQNATVSRISSGVVRTTHVTGVLTDLGLEIVNVLRPRAPRRVGGAETPAGLTVNERALLLTMILVGFGLGAGLGGILLAWSLQIVMLPPIVFLIWIVWLDQSQPVADLVRETSPMSSADAGTADLPPTIALFRLRCAGRRRGQPHRLPNMTHWGESLGPEVRTAVIDLSEAKDIEFAGAEELCLLAERFFRSGRSLVLAGVTPGRFPSLREAGLDRLLPIGSVARDVPEALAFARARAMQQLVVS